MFTSSSVLAASLTMDGDSVTTDDGSVTGLTVDAGGESAYSKAQLSPDTDGETKETEIQFRIVVTTDDLDGGDGRERDEFTSNNAAATVTVTNEASTSNAGGSGAVDVTGVDKDPSDNTNPSS